MNNDPSILGILTLNIGSPSARRAERQLEWLAERPEDVLVLSETSATTGSRLVAERLSGAGWDVRFPALDDSERGVLVASRVRVDARPGDLVEYLPARTEVLPLAQGVLEIVGVYVPSRDESLVKTERKQRFAAELLAALRRRARRPAVLVGDLNVVEPDHWPRYGFFHDWEYGLYTGLADAGWVDAYRLLRSGSIEHSWVGPYDDGFRFDHVFVTQALREAVCSCSMLHETRLEGLTDHSALTVSLTCNVLERVPVERSLSGGPLALF
jgi:exodeoxyribonuclease III